MKGSRGLGTALAPHLFSEPSCNTPVITYTRSANKDLDSTAPQEAFNATEEEAGPYFLRGGETHEKFSWPSDRAMSSATCTWQYVCFEACSGYPDRCMLIVAGLVESF